MSSNTRTLEVVLPGKNQTGLLRSDDSKIEDQHLRLLISSAAFQRQPADEMAERICAHLCKLALGALHNEAEALRLLMGWIYNPPAPSPGWQPASENLLRYQAVGWQALAVWLLARTGHFRKYQYALEHLCASKAGWAVIQAVFADKTFADSAALLLPGGGEGFPALRFPAFNTEAWGLFYAAHHAPKPWETDITDQVNQAKDLVARYCRELIDTYQGGWDRS